MHLISWIHPRGSETDIVHAPHFADYNVGYIKPAVDSADYHVDDTKPTVDYAL
jgi:hypothetical protein